MRSGRWKREGKRSSKREAGKWSEAITEVMTSGILDRLPFPRSFIAGVTTRGSPTVFVQKWPPALARSRRSETDQGGHQQ
jgi:hypothetical protein